MAIFVLKDAHVSIATEDLSDHVRQISFPYEAEEVDSTVMGPDGAREFLAGLLTGSATIEFAQDFDASEVDATLFPLVGAAPFAVVIRPTSAVKSATNPEFQWNAILTNYPILDGNVGDLATSGITLRLTGKITRDAT